MLLQCNDELHPKIKGIKRTLFPLMNMIGLSVTNLYRVCMCMAQASQEEEQSYQV